MSVPEKLLSRLCPLRPFPLPQQARRTCRQFFATLSTRGCQQKIPLGGYYENILRNAQSARPARPPPQANSTSSQDTHYPLSDPRAADEKTKTPLDTSISFDTSPPAPPPPHTTTAATMTPQEKVRIVFGSRLLGPAEQEDRAVAKMAQSTLIAGILVPPQPEEPDNCCMSGCINCVWDRYGEDLDEWTAKKTEAEGLLRAMGGGFGADAGRAGEVKMKTKTREELEEEAYSDVPAGIREFIKMEKRMREKHGHEAMLG